MPQQPEFTRVLPDSPADQPVRESPHPLPNQSLAGHRPHAPHRIPHWLQRAELFVRVLLRMYIGLAICYAPWSRLFWDQNPLFTHYPTLSIVLANGAVRGIISGLGLLNLWIAFKDVIQHRDD